MVDHVTRKAVGTIKNDLEVEVQKMACTSTYITNVMGLTGTVSRVQLHYLFIEKFAPSKGEGVG